MNKIDLGNSYLNAQLATALAEHALLRKIWMETPARDTEACDRAERAYLRACETVARIVTVAGDL